jgi:hypothetical protein
VCALGVDASTAVGIGADVGGATEGVETVCGACSN